MAWTALCTKDEIKREFPPIVDADLADKTLDEIIEDAKDIIYDDLSRFVDWDEVEALDTVPRAINRMARYQTILLVLIRYMSAEETYFGDGTGEDDSIYAFWMKRYKAFWEQIRMGDIIFLDADNEELEPDVARRPGIGRII